MGGAENTNAGDEGRLESVDEDSQSVEHPERTQGSPEETQLCSGQQHRYPVTMDHRLIVTNAYECVAVQECV